MSIETIWPYESYCLQLHYEYFQGPQKVKFGKVGFSDNVITAKNIIIATGSVPFVPKGIEVDGKCSSFPRPFIPMV